MLLDKFERHPLRAVFPPFAGMRRVESSRFYGPGYEDVQYRKPSIDNARRVLRWQPRIPLEQSVEKTLDFFLREEFAVAGNGAGVRRGAQRRPAPAATGRPTTPGARRSVAPAPRRRADPAARRAPGRSGASAARSRPRTTRPRPAG